MGREWTDRVEQILPRSKQWSWLLLQRVAVADKEGRKGREEWEMTQGGDGVPRRRETWEQTEKSGRRKEVGRQVQASTS